MVSIVRTTNQQGGRVVVEGGMPYAQPAIVMPATRTAERHEDHMGEEARHGMKEERGRSAQQPWCAQSQVREQSAQKAAGMYSRQEMLSTERLCCEGAKNGCPIYVLCVPTKERQSW